MSLKYWTCWNFTWATMEYCNILQYSPNLQTSLITTSIMGGYITYYSLYNDITPTIRIGDFRWKPNKLTTVIGDIIFHHGPLLFVIYKKKFRRFNKCSRSSIIPVLMWYSYIKLFYKNPHKFYNINIDTLLMSAFSVFLIQGIIGHNRISRFPPP